VLQTNWSLLQTLLGLSANREWKTDTSVPPAYNLEGVIDLTYAMFKYNTPKTDLEMSITMYPRLPDFDRLRMDIEVSLSQEIVKDFTIFLTLWDNYNDKPPTPDAAINDWGITTSFGYTF
jgi:hypothetical protein